MWKTRELSLIIIFAVTAFVYQGSMGQLPLLLTGIPGLGFILVIGLRIIYGTGFLFFEGRRWRYFVFVALFSLLLSIIHVSLNPFYIFANIPTLITAFLCDIIFNSFYENFEKPGQLKWLAILQLTFVSIVDVMMRFLILPILMPPEFTSTLTSVTMILLPLILFYGIIGGYFASRIYYHTNGILNFDH